MRVVSRRETILASVRDAISGAADPGVVRDYRCTLDEPDQPADLVALLVERVTDYRAEVRVVSSGELSRTIGAVLGEHAVHSVVVPADIDASWLTTVTCEVVRDHPQLTAADLNTIDAVVTASSVSIALTGTIVLDAGPAQGRRAISLVPDLHVCVVPADTIVGTVPEATRRLDPYRPLTWVSGPSATSDIELSRVEGVHGPRTLVVVLAG